MIYFIIFCLLIFQKSQSQTQNFTCEISTNDIISLKTCVLTKLDITESNKHFNVVSEKSKEKINYFRFEYSKVKILTDDVCKTLPYLTYFEAERIEVTVVEENAFEKCTDLKNVYLSQNKLQTLPQELFVKNLKLKEVHLYYNKLAKIDENIFKNNKYLQELYLFGNGLIEFSFGNEVPILKDLIYIDLGSNNLKTIDFKKILRKCLNESLTILFYDNRNLNLNKNITELKRKDIEILISIKSPDETNLEVVKNIKTTKKVLKKRTRTTTTTTTTMKTTKIKPTSKLTTISFKHNEIMKFTTDKNLETVTNSFIKKTTANIEKINQTISTDSDSNYSYIYIVFPAIAGSLITVLIYKFIAYFIKKFNGKPEVNVTEAVHYESEQYELGRSMGTNGDYYYGTVENFEFEPNHYYANQEFHNYDHLDFTRNTQNN